MRPLFTHGTYCHDINKSFCFLVNNEALTHGWKSISGTGYTDGTQYRIGSLQVTFLFRFINLISGQLLPRCPWAIPLASSRSSGKTRWSRVVLHQVGGDSVSTTVVFTAYISRWEYLSVVCVFSAQKLELYVPIFSCISSETPSLPLLVPTYPDQPGCVLKGWLYSLFLYDFTEPLLPAFEAQKSWPKLSDPCCKPQSGQDLSWSHHQDSSPFLSNQSAFFLLCCATETILCRLNRFSGHFWGPHKAVRLCELTWEYLSLLRPLKINKRTEALRAAEKNNYLGHDERYVPEGRAEVGLREQISTRGDTIFDVVDVDERELRIKHK